jgi:hypothetical protein
VQLHQLFNARFLKALLGAMLFICLHQTASATTTTYVLIVDWERSPDAIATFTFDDEDKAAARRVFWGGLVPSIAPRPDNVSFEGLVAWTHSAYSGDLYFDGTRVTSLALCDNFWSGCYSGPSSFGGFTELDFFVGGRGSALRATLDPDTLNDIDCGNRFNHPVRCLDYEVGTTTFVALTPTAPIPEASTWAMLMFGLFALYAFKRWPRSRHAVMSLN